MSTAEFHWNPEQTEAIARINDWVRGAPQELSLTGAAGTGKTTVLSEIKKLIKGPAMWAALTGKAALRMHQAAGVPASTLHSVLYDPPEQRPGGSLEFNRIAKPKGSFLIIDEASMMTPKLYEDLRQWKMRGVQILYVGDGYQLPPVMSPKEIKTYGDDFSVFKKVPGPTLKTVVRSGDDIIRIATMLREENRLPERNEGTYNFLRTEAPGSTAISDFLADQDDHILLTWRNAYRMEANTEIRKRLGYKSKLPSEGEPVLICKNGQAMLNGEVYLAQSFSSGPTLGEMSTQWFSSLDGKMALVNTTGRQMEMDGQPPEIQDWQEYGAARGMNKVPEPLPITYGYVLTAHKAQGSEYRRVTVFLAASDLRNPNFRQPTILPTGETMPFATRWLYTGITRAKERATLILGA